MKSEKLELKHLAGYLPYELMCLDLADGTDFWLDTLNIDMVVNESEHLNTIRLYLRPLSDLTKEIEVNGEKFIPALILAELSMGIENVDDIIKNSDSLGFDYKIVNKPFGKILKITRFDRWVLIISFNEPERCKHYIFQKFLEWHFDVFGLIEKGLAIDVNTL